VYGLPGTTTSSGQKTGDIGPPAASGTGPASSSSTGNSGSFSGGGNCNTPPACSGDTVMCGVARTQWATTCQLHTDLSGTQPAPSSTTLASGGAYNQASLWPTQTPGNTTGDAANQGNYDTSGFGFGTTCPMQDQPIPLWGGQTFTLPLTQLCGPASWLSYLVLGFAYFYAAKITAGAK